MSPVLTTPFLSWWELVIRAPAAYAPLLVATATTRAPATRPSRGDGWCWVMVAAIAPRPGERPGAPEGGGGDQGAHRDPRDEPRPVHAPRPAGAVDGRGHDHSLGLAMTQRQFRNRHASTRSRPASSPRWMGTPGAAVTVLIVAVFAGSPWIFSFLVGTRGRRWRATLRDRLRGGDGLPQPVNRPLEEIAEDVRRRGARFHALPPHASYVKVSALRSAYDLVLAECCDVAGAVAPAHRAPARARARPGAAPGRAGAALVRAAGRTPRWRTPSTRPPDLAR